ncbi:hypothetical protein B0G83_104115 [Paraburkholderia sp. BL21I4N1]|nr:hypothetical protein B0G83_104115 [Paraburkholderia sp. BL21I4N1]
MAASVASESPFRVELRQSDQGRCAVPSFVLSCYRYAGSLQLLPGSNVAQVLSFPQILFPARFGLLA